MGAKTTTLTTTTTITTTTIQWQLHLHSQGTPNEHILNTSKYNGIVNNK